MASLLRALIRQIGAALKHECPAKLNRTACLIISYQRLKPVHDPNQPMGILKRVRPDFCGNGLTTFLTLADAR